ncbi:ABC transporter permease [Actinoplanes subtropicus]|uniref:ABC transporter permease n=1 Tax=Actinoplanes subtropicus TaxID=543632 RepID=UPI0004C2E72D|nr:ABC transporter permease [Actinoplanes subtropicus]
MTRFLARRTAMLVATMLVASFAIYGALYVSPGSPLSALTGNRPLPPEAKAQLEARYHLNEPFLVRYWHWLVSALHGDLGESIPLHENVSTLIGQRVGVTAGLVLLTSVIIVIAGVGLGILGALGKGLVDNGVLLASTVSAALPSFAAAVVLQFVVAVKLGWLPALGTGHGFADSLRHLLLPALALAATSVALVTRVTRAAVREETGREHVQTAVSRGLPWPSVVRRHVLRNAAIPITTVVGITIASLIALSAVVETAFGLNGLGAYLVQAAQNKDVAVVQGISLVLVLAFVLTNMLVDIAYAVLDPRLTLGGRAA